MAAAEAPTDARTWLNWALLERRRDHYEPARRYGTRNCISMVGIRRVVIMLCMRTLYGGQKDSSDLAVVLQQLYNQS